MPFVSLRLLQINILDLKTWPLRPKSGRAGHFPDRRDMSQIHFINALEKATTETSV